MKEETKVKIKFIGYDLGRRALSGYTIGLGGLEMLLGGTPGIIIGGITVLNGLAYLKYMCPDTGSVGKPFMKDITTEYDRLLKEERDCMKT
ncbi:MAG: hypothetical protein PHU12_03255 [Candidatus Aenigmarchaeota archaeon]|nr:hypothetical protein [Candidatus Aenigmarchaeota archaeon]